MWNLGIPGGPVQDGYNFDVMQGHMIISRLSDTRHSPPDSMTMVKLYVACFSVHLWGSNTNSRDTYEFGDQSLIMTSSGKAILSI